MWLAPVASDTHPKKKKFSWRVQMSVPPRFSSRCHGSVEASDTIATDNHGRNQFNQQIHEVFEEIRHCFQGGTELRCVCKGQLV